MKCIRPKLSVKAFIQNNIQVYVLAFVSSVLSNVLPERKSNRRSIGLVRGGPTASPGRSPTSRRPSRRTPPRSSAPPWDASATEMQWMGYPSLWQWFPKRFSRLNFIVRDFRVFAYPPSRFVIFLICFPLPPPI